MSSLSIVVLAKILALVKRGLISSRQPVVNLGKGLVEPCFIADPILMGKRLDGDGGLTCGD